MKGDLLPIDKGIPIPPDAKGIRGKSGPRLVASAKAMEVGDSIFVSGKHPAEITWQLGQCKPFKFTTRKVDGGARVWRVA